MEDMPWSGITGIPPLSMDPLYPLVDEGPGSSHEGSLGHSPPTEALGHQGAGWGRNRDGEEVNRAN